MKYSDYYSISDVISTSETDEKLFQEKLRLKEVYFGKTPEEALDNANTDFSLFKGTIVSFKEEKGSFVFIIQVPRKVKVNSYKLAYIEEYVRSQYIILNRNDAPYYRPFKSHKEFLRAYEEHSRNINQDLEEAILSRYGMWIKAKKQQYPKNEEYYASISEITEVGITLATRNLRGELVGTSDVAIDTRYIPWYYLVKDYLFLDGSPCGILMDEWYGKGEKYFRRT